VTSGEQPPVSGLARGASNRLHALSERSDEALRLMREEGFTAEQAAAAVAPSGEHFHGLPGRECGEHRTLGGRAWCHDCTEYCYPEGPCRGCELPGLRAALDKITAALQEIEREATGSGILQPGAAYAFGVLAQACGVQPGDTAADLAARLTAGEHDPAPRDPPSGSTAPPSGEEGHR
jgi:hypothetical protein